MRLNQSEKQLIRSSFGAIRADTPAAAQSFYRHLFQSAPALRGLFVASMDQQGVKLINTLSTVVEQIETWGLLQTALEDLAIRHLAYGVRPEDYRHVGEALQSMLAERLGLAHTPGVAQAWNKAYAAISSAMIAAAYPASSDDEIPLTP